MKPQATYRFLRFALAPFSLLYGIVIWLRNTLFDYGILSSKAFETKVVSVGNITVGGTGKTPFAEYLISLLSGVTSVAYLSRGYGRKTKGFLTASHGCTPHWVGDEGCQVKKRFPGTIVAVDEKRARGIEKILIEAPETGCIVLDDAFQHRYVKPGLSIVLVDFNRPVNKDMLLPAGNLREPVRSIKRADVMVVTKCRESLTVIEKHSFLSRFKWFPSHNIFFSAFQYGTPYPLFDSHNEAGIPQETSILLVCGIANPHPLFKHISQHFQKTVPFFYRDHHHYTAHDADKIAKAFLELKGHNRAIITTEKDAVKFIALKDNFEGVHNRIFVLPVQVRILFDKGEAFNRIIHEYITTGKVNR